MALTECHKSLATIYFLVRKQLSKDIELTNEVEDASKFIINQAT